MADIDAGQVEAQNKLAEAAQTLVDEFGWTKREVVAEVESVL